METAQEVLEYMSEYADFCLEEAEKEVDPTKSREKYIKYAGMRELINVAIDEMKNK